MIGISLGGSFFLIKRDHIFNKTSSGIVVETDEDGVVLFNKRKLK